MRLLLPLALVLALVPAAAAATAREQPVAGPTSEASSVPVRLTADRTLPKNWRAEPTGPKPPGNEYVETGPLEMFDSVRNSKERSAPRTMWLFCRTLRRTVKASVAKFRS